MKTLQELFDEVTSTDEKKQEFVEAMKNSKVKDFLRQHDCDATPEELGEFLKAKAADDDTPVELSMDELEKVAGGSYEDTFYCSNFNGCTETCCGYCC